MWSISLISALGLALVFAVAWLRASVKTRKVASLAAQQLRRDGEQERRLINRHQYEMARAEQRTTFVRAKEREIAQTQLAALRRQLELKHKQELVPVARLLANRKFEENKRKEAKRVNGLLASLVKRASALYDAKQWEQAVAPLEQLVAVAQYSGMQDVEAQAVYCLAKNYDKLGDLRRAEILFKQALNVASQVWTMEEKPELLRKYQQKWKAAEERVITRQVSAMCQEAAATVMLNPQLALQIYQQAATVAERSDLPLLQAAVVNNTFRAYVGVGELESGRDALQSALALAKKHDKDPTLASALELNIATVETMIKARPFQRILSEVYENLEARDEIDIDARMQRAEVAEECARKALEEACRTFGDDDWRVALACDRIGLARFAQGRFQAALPAFNRARMILLENSNSYQTLFLEVQDHLALCRRAIEMD